MHPWRPRWGRWRFAPGLWPTLAAVLLIALTLWLGNWQTQRAAYKRSLQARVDVAERTPALRMGAEGADKNHLLYRRVEVQGVFDSVHEILLDNRIYNGVAGYHVLTPLRIANSERAVLVNRGWLPVGGSRNTLPAVSPVAGSVKIEGLAIDPETRYFELPGAQPQGRVWQNLNFEHYAARTGLDLQPVVVQQTNDTGDRLIRDWPRPDTGVAMHTGYAIQWYGLAATLAVLWVVLNLKRIN